MARKYPWETWFGRERTVLERGIDYHISQSMMHQTIRNNASQRGLKVRVKDTGSGMTIEVTKRVSDDNARGISEELSHPDKVAVTDEPAGSLAHDGTD